MKVISPVLLGLSLAVAGSTLSAALSECVRNIRRFEYEGPEQASTTA